MNNTLFEQQWQQLKSFILAKWNKLTEDDLRQIGGRYDQFIAKLQEKYGYTREQAEDQVRDWKPNVTADYNRDTVKKESSRPSWLPWALLAAGLLLLWAYWGNREEPTTTAPTTTQTTQTSPATDDAAATQNLRDALAGSGDITSSNIQIEVRNGVATIRGTIPTATQKDKVTSIASRVPNVAKVNNLLEVTP